MFMQPKDWVPDERPNSYSPSVSPATSPPSYSLVLTRERLENESSYSVKDTDSETLYTSPFRTLVRQCDNARDPVIEAVH